MSGEFVRQTFPRGPLLGAAALVAFTLIATAAARLERRAGQAPADSDPTAVVALNFADRSDGAVVVLDGASGATVETIEPGTGGFLRATLRALVRERRQSALGDEQAFELRRYADGRLELYDRATARQIYLDAFGPTNVAAFAALLDPEDLTR
jgi:putative photosynthetic complex assembly protein